MLPFSYAASAFVIAVCTNAVVATFVESSPAVCVVAVVEDDIVPTNCPLNVVATIPPELFIEALLFQPVEFRPLSWKYMIPLLSTIFQSL